MRSTRVAATMFRYTEARKVQPVGVEIVVRRTGAEAAYYELQVIIGGDWHETIVVDIDAMNGALFDD